MPRWVYLSTIRTHCAAAACSIWVAEASGRVAQLASHHLTLAACPRAGGLLSESLARLGASVTGVDASAVAVDVASRHARESALDITYLQGSAETLLADAQRRPFDLVVCSEVIEHVADAAELVGHLASLSDGGRVGCVVRCRSRIRLPHDLS